MSKESSRYWLTFDVKNARRPLIWEMSKKFDLIFDIRSATVTSELGLMAIELTGDPKVIDAALKWFRRRGVDVAPVV